MSEAPAEGLRKNRARRAQEQMAMIHSGPLPERVDQALPAVHVRWFPPVKGSGGRGALGLSPLVNKTKGPRPSFEQFVGLSCDHSQLSRPKNQVGHVHRPSDSPFRRQFPTDGQTLGPVGIDEARSMDQCRNSSHRSWPIRRNQPPTKRQSAHLCLHLRRALGKRLRCLQQRPQWLSGVGPGRKTNEIKSNEISALWPFCLIGSFAPFSGLLAALFRSLRFTLRSASRTVLLSCVKAGPPSQAVVHSEANVGHVVHVCFIVGYAQLHGAGGTSVLAPTPSDFGLGLFRPLRNPTFCVSPSHVMEADGAWGAFERLLGVCVCVCVCFFVCLLTRCSLAVS